MGAEASTPKMKILVGFDGSDVSRTAARKAAELAKSLGRSLWLVHAIPPLNTAVLGDFSGFASAELIDVQKREAVRLLQRVREELATPELPVEVSVFVDPPAALIARLAEDPSVELVVIGATGAGAVARLLLGSVALRLLHLCRKPILVVPRSD